MDDRARLNAELYNNPFDAKVGADEKAALRRARKAERAFRVAKGYEPDTLWNRIRKKLKI